MAVDKSKNTQILVTIPNEMLGKIEDYRFKNKCSNRNEAIRALIQKGINVTEKEK